jgi:leader peptidase (prepilin peptidase)/N-methyltransferase
MAHALEPILAGGAGHAFAFLLGALLGSFANVCIYRLPPSDDFPTGRSIVHPPSHCPACLAPIAWYDNVPLLAYLWLRGRCRRCRAGFSARYLLVEAATAILFVALFHLHVVVLSAEAPVPERLARFAVAVAFAFVLVVVTFIDLDHKLILDRITYPAIPLFYALGLTLGRPWVEGLIGAAVGYGVIRLVADGYFLLTRRRGLGYGDGKLLAIVGAWLGWPGVVVSLFVGSLIGTVIGLGYIAIAGRGRLVEAPLEGAPLAEGTSAPPAGSTPGSIRHLEIPFGPFLAAGALVYLFVEIRVRTTLRAALALLYSGGGG